MRIMIFFKDSQKVKFVFCSPQPGQNTSSDLFLKLSLQICKVVARLQAPYFFWSHTFINFSGCSCCLPHHAEKDCQAGREWHRCQRYKCTSCGSTSLQSGSRSGSCLRLRICTNGYKNENFDLLLVKCTLANLSYIYLRSSVCHSVIMSQLPNAELFFLF